jgi:hypothetical protein
LYFMNSRWTHTDSCATLYIVLMYYTQTAWKCRIQSSGSMPEQGATRSEWLVLHKRCNAALVYCLSSHRAKREAIIFFVLKPWTRMTSPSVLCL